MKYVGFRGVRTPRKIDV